MTQTYLAGKLEVPQPLISCALTVDDPRPVPTTVPSIVREFGED